MLTRMILDYSNAPRRFEMSDTEAEETLLSKMTEVTGLAREDDETAEAFKGRLVKHFADAYPNTDEGNKAYDGLDDDVTDWVDAATDLARKNRSSRKVIRLPELAGLVEDAEEPKGSKRGSKSKEPKAAKEPGASRAGVQRVSLAEKFVAAPDGAKTSKFLAKPLRAAGFSLKRERSAEGHMVYAKDGGDEIHVGPGKAESAYLMGWRIPGETQHRYGGVELEEYLDKKYPA